LKYLRFTGRSDQQVKLVDAYCKAQGMFRTDASPDPVFSDTIELDLGTVEPSLAGPKRPQDRVPLARAKAMFAEALEAELERFGERAAGRSSLGTGGSGGVGVAPAAAAAGVSVRMRGQTFTITHGAVVIAAITSCTNTSNPSVMIGAGLLAKKAVDKGLTVKPWVKTSLAPGSKVVSDYYRKSGLMAPLEKLGFYLAGYGCT